MLSVRPKDVHHKNKQKKPDAYLVDASFHPVEGCSASIGQTWECHWLQDPKTMIRRAKTLKL